MITVADVFMAPGIQEEQVGKGLKLAIEILGEFGNGKEPWWKIFKP